MCWIIGKVVKVTDGTAGGRIGAHGEVSAALLEDLEPEITCDGARRHCHCENHRRVTSRNPGRSWRSCCDGQSMQAAREIITGL